MTLACSLPARTNDEKSAAIKFKQLTVQFLVEFEVRTPECAQQDDSPVLCALQKTAEADILSQLRETESLVQKGVFDVNKPVKPCTRVALPCCAVLLTPAACVQQLRVDFSTLPSGINVWKSSNGSSNLGFVL